MEDNDIKLVFANTLKQIRCSRDFSIRGIAKVLDFSPVYISDLERGNRLPSLELINRMNDYLVLSETEKEMINIAYFTLHPNIPLDLVYYIMKNDLIGILQTLKSIDEDGTKLKKLVLDMNKDSDK